MELVQGKHVYVKATTDNGVQNTSAVLMASIVSHIHEVTMECRTEDKGVIFALHSCKW